MGWGWPFSSSESQSAPTPASSNPTEARTTSRNAAPQNATATVQNYQLELLRLEKERLELMIKLKQQEAATHALTQTQTQTQKPASLATTLAPMAAQRQARAAPPVEPPRSLEAPWLRTTKQLGLFFAGASFLTASALISRRAVNRKMITSYPKLFQPSHHGPTPPPRAPHEKSDDQLVAVEALGLATLNVFSFAVMLTGGLMFAFDISNVEELRWKARKSLYGPNGVVDEEAEQEVEDWIVDVLSRRDKNDGDKSESDPKKDA